MKKLIAIIGAGDFGVETVDIIRGNPLYNDTVVYFVDPRLPDGSIIYGVPVVAAISDIPNPEGCPLNGVVAIGAPRRKELAAGTIPDGKFHLAPIVDKTVEISPSASIGVGCIICHGAFVSSRSSLGSHVTVNAKALIGHDVLIGDFCTIQPAAVLLGGVVLGKSVEVGAGAILHSRVKVGDGAKVGLGAVVIRDVPPGVTVAGNPARIFIAPP